MSVVMNAINSEHTPERDYASDPKRKVLAKKIYMEMPIIRFDWIAAQTGLEKDLIKQWAADELWLRQRTVKREELKKLLETKIKSQHDVDLKTISICDRLIDDMHQELKSQNYSREDHAKLIKSLNEVTDMRVRAFERLVRKG